MTYSLSRSLLYFPSAFFYSFPSSIFNFKEIDIYYKPETRILIYNEYTSSIRTQIHASMLFSPHLGFLDPKISTFLFVHYHFIPRTLSNKTLHRHRVFMVYIEYRYTHKKGTFDPIKKLLIQQNFYRTIFNQTTLWCQRKICLINNFWTKALLAHQKFVWLNKMCLNMNFVGSTTTSFSEWGDQKHKILGHKTLRLWRFLNEN